jgi:hypothetical protein
MLQLSDVEDSDSECEENTKKRKIEETNEKDGGFESEQGAQVVVREESCN